MIVVQGRERAGREKLNTLKPGILTPYRLAAGLAIVATLLIVWINLAVGIIGEPDHPANLLYAGVPAVALAGALVARFRPGGMANALLLAALAQALVGAVTLAARLGAPVTPWQSYVVLNAILLAFWLSSARLFRRAAG